MGSHAKAARIQARSEHGVARLLPADTERRRARCARLTGHSSAETSSVRERIALFVSTDELPVRQPAEGRRSTALLPLAPWREIWWVLGVSLAAFMCGGAWLT